MKSENILLNRVTMSQNIAENYKISGDHILELYRLYSKITWGKYAEKVFNLHFPNPWVTKDEIGRMRVEMAHMISRDNEISDNDFVKLFELYCKITGRNYEE